MTPFHFYLIAAALIGVIIGDFISMCSGDEEFDAEPLKIYK